MKPSKRLERIPPYAFAELERKIAAKRAAGADVISLGIGDPDRRRDDPPRHHRTVELPGGHGAGQPHLQGLSRRRARWDR